MYMPTATAASRARYRMNCARSSVRFIREGSQRAQVGGIHCRGGTYLKLYSLTSLVHFTGSIEHASPKPVALKKALILFSFSCAAFFMAVCMGRVVKPEIVTSLRHCVAYQTFAMLSCASEQAVWGLIFKEVAYNGSAIACNASNFVAATWYFTWWLGFVLPASAWYFAAAWMHIGEAKAVDVTANAKATTNNFPIRVLILCGM
ncbi:MAG: hypothetical protein ACR2P7_08020 [bacterium]